MYNEPTYTHFDMLYISQLSIVAMPITRPRTLFNSNFSCHFVKVRGVANDHL